MRREDSERRRDRAGTKRNVPNGTRRRVLASTVAGIAGALAGCLDGLANGDDADEDDEDDDIPPGGIGDGEHRLYLANLDDATHEIDLEVYDRHAEERVVDGTYELPGGKGAEFEPIAGVEIRYDVTATVADGGSLDVTWAPGPCDTTGGSSQNAAVRIQPGGEELTLVEDNCDEISAGTSASFGPAAEFYVEGS